MHCLGMFFFIIKCTQIICENTLALLTAFQQACMHLRKSVSQCYLRQHDISNRSMGLLLRVQLDACLPQATAKLYQLEQLGPDFFYFEVLYRDLQEDLDHANFTLAEFQKASADE